MAILHVGTLSFDAHLVIFDKDGTLIDLHQVWGRQTVIAVERLVATVAGDDSLRRDLLRSLGYDPQLGRVDETGPLAMASVEKLYTTAATVMYQYGFAWHEAELHVRDSFKAAMDATPLEELVQPLADVKTLLGELQRAGVRVGIVTTDDRQPTQQTLALLGIEDHVDFLACGDDQVPLKPAPDAVLAACAGLGVEPARTLLVGDTIADLLMGERAGVGCLAAVLTGAGKRDQLAAHCDIVLDSIAEISLSTVNAAL